MSGTPSPDIWTDKVVTAIEFIMDEKDISNRPVRRYPYNSPSSKRHCHTLKDKKKQQIGAKMRVLFREPPSDMQISTATNKTIFQFEKLVN
jgi:hypothetical protein